MSDLNEMIEVAMQHRFDFDHQDDELDLKAAIAALVRRKVIPSEHASFVFEEAKKRIEEMESATPNTKLNMDGADQTMPISVRQTRADSVPGKRDRDLRAIGYVGPRVGPDSSAIHFAAASEVPCLSLWGAFDPESRVKYYLREVPIVTPFTPPAPSG